MAAVGFGNTGGDVFERGGPYLVRGAADLVPTSALLDEYSPALFCTIRNYHDVEPKIASSLGGNGYSLRTALGDPRRRQPVRLSRQPAAGERPAAAPRAGPAAGSPSPVTCGPCRTW